MIANLRLQNFRSYRDASFELSPGVNIIVGPNASGKTNLLEAILVLAIGSSYRAKDSDMVRFNAPWARVDAQMVGGGQRTLKLATKPAPLKTLEFGGKQYRRLMHAHRLPIILFEPNHLLLLSGGPERRREYLDDLLEQTTPGYGNIRRQYRRFLAQRNALLKQPGRANQTNLFPWSLRLSQLAGQIVRARCGLVAELNTKIGALYRELSGSKTKVTLVYEQPWPLENYETRLLKKLETDQELDMRRGFTGSGPHREDLIVAFDGRLLSAAASRGEARTTILALKILEIAVIEAVREIQPLLLLDDVFSELDGKRRHALTDYLAPYQTFITTTDADVVLHHFTNNAQVIPLRSGG